MGKQEVAFDPEIFARTASLFAQKRSAFAPDAVEALAGDVLRRLASSTKPHDQFDISAISDDSIEAFCAALVRPQSDPARQFIEDRRAEGITRMGVYLGYICAAARRLGEGWDNEQLSFIDVTIGTGHLYALMRALRAERSSARMEFDARRCALFATVPGEDHGIGITVAADLFRENGWDIDLQIGTSHDDLIARAEGTQPAIIGLSLSTEGRLDTLVRLVVALRLILPETVIGVAPAAGLNVQRIHDLVDIDLVFTSAQSACADLEQMIRCQS